MDNKTLEDGINEAKELVEKVKELLIQREGHKFELKYIGYDIYEDEYEENEDIYEDDFVINDDNIEDVIFFQEDGLSRHHDICIKIIYLNNSGELMFDLIDRPYYYGADWYDDYTLVQSRTACQILDRFDARHEPYDFIYALKKIMGWIAGHSQQ